MRVTQEGIDDAAIGVAVELQQDDRGFSQATSQTQQDRDFSTFGIDLDQVEILALQILNKPLSEILADREKALEAAGAWDAFGAMWVLSQRAMRRVAMDLAAQQGVSEAEVVARAMRYANAVLNTEDETLGGSIAPAQLAHIARHKPFLRKQFRQG